MFEKFALQTIGICLLVGLFGCLVDARIKTISESVVAVSKDIAKIPSRDVGCFETKTSVSAEATAGGYRQGLLIINDVRRDNKVIKDKHGQFNNQMDWTDPFILQASSRILSRTFTFLLGDLSIQIQIVILSIAAEMIVSIVGIYVILSHSPGAV